MDNETKDIVPKTSEIDEISNETSPVKIERHFQAKDTHMYSANDSPPAEVQNPYNTNEGDEGKEETHQEIEFQFEEQHWEA